MDRAKQGTRSCSILAAAANLWAALRQRFFRPEFRIDASVLAVPEAASEAHQAKVDEKQPGDGALGLMREVGTGVWRIQRCLKKVGASGNEPDAIRPIRRHTDWLWDALHESGVEIRDREGERYVPGLPVEVIAFQPRQGVGREMVEETIRPSIFYQGTLIQRGRVVVAEPKERGSNAALGDRATTDTKNTKSAEQEDAPGESPRPGAHKGKDPETGRSGERE